MKEQLLARIQDRSAVIALVGLGYVGLPLAVAFAEHGFSVRGIDVDQTKVERLNCADSYVQDIPSARLAPLVASGKFRATTNFAALDDCDAAIIAVPTPLNKTRDPDVRYLIAAGEAVAAHVHPGMLVSLESTTYPARPTSCCGPCLRARACGPARISSWHSRPSASTPVARIIRSRTHPRSLAA